eukprot:1370072-Prymnesium_polylepis.1
MSHDSPVRCSAARERTYKKTTLRGNTRTLRMTRGARERFRSTQDEIIAAVATEGARLQLYTSGDPW